jgi:hypothetical protein
MNYGWFGSKMFTAWGKIRQTPMSKSDQSRKSNLGGPRAKYNSTSCSLQLGSRPSCWGPIMSIAGMITNEESARFLNQATAKCVPHTDFRYWEIPHKPSGHCSKHPCKRFESGTSRLLRLDFRCLLIQKTSSKVCIVHVPSESGNIEFE